MLKKKKIVEKTLYEKKKKCHLCVFVLLTHQTAKTQKKKKKKSAKIFSKNIYFEYFGACYLPKHQNLCKLPDIGNRNDFNRNVMSVFQQ